jgi:integrase
MAFLFKRERSPYWWIEFSDLAGKTCRRSTKLRHEITADTRKARDLCRELGSEENRVALREEAWDAWVHRFLEQQYSDQQESLKRYRIAWRNIAAFLNDKNIVVPRALTRQHVRDYIGWRAVPHDGVYAARRNTALLEIKLLGLVMREAVQSGFASVNPCEKLGIGREPAARKPRITDVENKIITEGLRDKPEWMRISYKIAWEQGCRFSETRLHIPTQVDLNRMVIRFRTKGRKAELAEFPLSPRLVSLFRYLIEEGREWTFDQPSFASKAWWRFFRNVGLPHLCFHCTRVTFITRCYESGIPREGVMRLAGHSNYAAHQVYPRVTADHATVQAMRQLL